MTGLGPTPPTPEEPTESPHNAPDAHQPPATPPPLRAGSAPGVSPIYNQGSPTNQGAAGKPLPDSQPMTMPQHSSVPQQSQGTNQPQGAQRSRSEQHNGMSAAARQSEISDSEPETVYYEPTSYRSDLGPDGDINSIDDPRDQSAPFFKSLFDFSFKNFITLKFASFIYWLFICFVVLVYIVVVVTVFTSEGFLPGLSAMLLGIPAALLYIVMTRISLEFIVATIRTAQNTTKLAERS